MFLRQHNLIRRTITFRLALWSSGVFILSTSFLFALAYVLLSSSMQQKDREDIHQKLGEFAAQYRLGGLDGLKNEVALEQKTGKRHSLFVRLAGPQNRTLFLDAPDQWSNSNLAQLEKGPVNESAQPTRLQTRNGKNSLEMESALLSNGVLLQVGKSTEEREELLARFRAIFLSFMVSVIFLGIASGSFLASRTLRPIRSLIHTIRSISIGRMNARVPSSQTGDELDELVMLFNAMLEKIETLINGMRGSLDNVAHDLRTPITRLRGTAEMALCSEPNLEAYREVLADCVEESERILTMLNTLMDISEAETGAMKLRLEAVNLSALMEDTVELYRYTAEDKEITLRVNSPNDLFLTVDRNRMRQVLANLLDNAIKYTPSGGRIELEAFRQEQQAVLRIRDTGIGISPEETPRIWDRLYRADQSRSQRGLGLGLSLVKAVVQAHQGRIEVCSQLGVGSLFTLYLPIGSAPIS